MILFFPWLLMGASVSFYALVLSYSLGSLEVSDYARNSTPRAGMPSGDELR
ncbi:hypothetical protein ANO14919_041880 [Xylariales sp. No.14919]|nr:hypothetical protein ANO14919_041880 [Xylariales sp. No.14919]